MFCTPISMTLNSDINILGGLPDLNLIKHFMIDSIESLNSRGGHRSYTAIKTDKSVHRFEKAITDTLLSFKNIELEPLLRNMVAAESISQDSLFLFFLNASNNNELLNYLNESVYFPALYSGRVGIKTTEVVACLTDLKQTEPELHKWSDSTLKVTASKYLTLLKKFHLMDGSVNKTIAHTYLNDKMFILFVYWLLTVEQKPNILESPWLNYSFSEKRLFLERVLQKKFSKYYNLNFNGDKLTLEPLISYQNIYDELTKS